jgi:hypothetical protein
VTIKTGLLVRMTGIRQTMVMTNQVFSSEDREQLAVAVRRLVSEAEKPRIRMWGAPIARAQVASAATELRLLAARLQAPGRVDPRGILEVSRLLTDGCGPLYNRGSEQPLATAVTAARLALGPVE